MNDDGTVYAFNPFAGQAQLPLLTPQVIQHARDADQSHWASQATYYRTQSPACEAEYKIIYHLEVLWNAVKVVLKTYGRLGIDVRISEDDLSYEDDLVWMGAKTEIGAAGEGLRRIVASGTGSESAGAAGSPISATGSASGSVSGSSTAGGTSGTSILQRLRQGDATDAQLAPRMKTLVRIHDVLMRGKKQGSNWITETTVLRFSVYSVVLQGFGGYPLWHEDREFADQLASVVQRFKNYDA